MRLTEHFPFVVVEGLDATGKTTLARLLARDLGAPYLTTPDPDLRALRPDILRSLDAPEARQLFYAATVVAASDHVEDLRYQGTPAVVDRYWLSTMVYAAHRGHHFLLKEIESWLAPADLTVFLDAPLPVRRDRLAARGASPADLETLDPDFDAAIRQGYLDRRDHEIVGRLLHLDSHALTPAELVRAVLDALS